MPDPLAIPNHIAIIMDGNGRWAKSRGLPRTAGHQRGASAVERTVEGCIQLGVRYLTLYAFSEENWKRPEKEVSALMRLLELFLNKHLKNMLKRDIRLRTIGRTEQLPLRVKTMLDETVEKTKGNRGITLNLALSYGGREELVDATRNIAEKVAAGQLSPEEITNDSIQQHLYAPDIPDPDLLIRTSGEIRLSNFLLWQLSYTEMVLIKKFWPEFKISDLEEAIHIYQTRHRRYGAIS